MAVLMKRGDTYPPVLATFVDPLSGVPIDLSTATVVFNARQVRGQAVLERRPVQVFDPAAGRVQYVWEEGDTDVAGHYLCEFEMTLPLTPHIRFTTPTSGYIHVIVWDDLDGGGS